MVLNSLYINILSNHRKTISIFSSEMAPNFFYYKGLWNYGIRVYMKRTHLPMTDIDRQKIKIDPEHQHFLDLPWKSNYANYYIVVSATIRPKIQLRISLPRLIYNLAPHVPATLKFPLYSADFRRSRCIHQRAPIINYIGVYYEKWSENFYATHNTLSKRWVEGPFKTAVEAADAYDQIMLQINTSSLIKLNLLSNYGITPEGLIERYGYHSKPNISCSIKETDPTGTTTAPSRA